MCKQLHNGSCPYVSKPHILRTAAIGIGLAYSQGRIGNRSRILPLPLIYRFYNLEKMR